MSSDNVARALAAAVVAAALVAPPHAQAQRKEVKIGVIYDYTGPFAAGGSQAAALGTKIAIDMINERGGVEGYKIDADLRRRAVQGRGRDQRGDPPARPGEGEPDHGRVLERALRADGAEGRRGQEVHVGQRVHRLQRVQGQEPAATCSARRCTPTSSARPPARSSTRRAKRKLNKDPKDIKVAIIYEDGPYGTGVAAGNEETCKKFGMQIVLKEGYSATAPDLSSLVTKLRRARADVILHTGYNPDITLFWRQAREQGLKWAALIGHGAGYASTTSCARRSARIPSSSATSTRCPRSCSIRKSLAPGLGKLTQEMVKRYKAETKVDEVPPHVSMGFNQTWIFLTDVLPRAIKKYGGIDPEALRKAALDTDIPDGGTIQGYGVKFHPPGDEMSGQNERSSPVVMQYINGNTEIVWPARLRTADPVLPWPKSHSYSNQ